MFTSSFNYAVKSHSALLTLPVQQREQVLVGFQSRVRELDVLNQAMSKKWSTFMTEGLLGHIKSKLWLQKAKWSDRLLSSGDLMDTSSNCLNMHSLRSPLCTPYGVMVDVLLSMYDNIGDRGCSFSRICAGFRRVPVRLSL